jgi:hypothetical protein
MDFSKFKTSDWLLVAAGVIMLIFGIVLDWAKVGSVSGNGPFDYFFTGGISWLLVVAAGVIAFLLAAGIMKPGGAPWSLLLVLGTGLATLLMLLRIIMGGGDEAGFELDRGPGMYVAFVAAIIALVGAVMNYKATGGDLNDLKDFNKIKGAFAKPGDSDPAPPPPPPPPPPAI